MVTFALILLRSFHSALTVRVGEGFKLRSVHSKTFNIILGRINHGKSERESLLNSARFVASVSDFWQFSLTGPESYFEFVKND